MSVSCSSIWEGIQDFFLNTDYDNKSIIRSNFVAPATAIGYFVVTTYIGPYFMRNRQPYDLQHVIILYNAIMVVLNFYVAHGYILTAAKLNLWDALCPADPDKVFMTAKQLLRPYTWMFLMLKYVEFLDSIFFVLRKRFDLLTYLHRIHHASVPIIAIIFLRFNVGICAYFAGVFNASVHVVMYFYYGMAASGPRFRKYLWWKKYLTTLQIVQFITNISCLVINGYTGCYPVRSSEICQVCINGFFLILFLNYFLRQLVKVQGELSFGTK